MSGEVELLDRLPQQAPFTSCAGVAPRNMRGIKIAHNEEGLVACVLESRLEDVMECVLRVSGRAVDIKYVKLSVSYTFGEDGREYVWNVERQAALLYTVVAVY